MKASKTFSKLVLSPREWRFGKETERQRTGQKDAKHKKKETEIRERATKRKKKRIRKKEGKRMEIREIHSGDLGSRGRACRRKGKRQDQDTSPGRSRLSYLSPQPGDLRANEFSLSSRRDYSGASVSQPSPAQQEKVEPQTGAGLQ